MAFAPSLTSVDSNFSLSDSVSDIASLDTSADDDTKPAVNEEDFTSGHVEDSLDNSIITVIVSLQGMLAVLCLTGIVSTGRRHPLSSRFSLPPKRIRDIEGHHYRIQDRLNPPEKRYSCRV